jgi:HSP20 family protein
MSNLVRYNRQTLPSIFEDDFFGPTDILLDRFLSKSFPEFTKIFGTSVFETAAYPKVDVRETEKEFIIEAEIPGLDKEQVKVEVKDDVLVLRGEKRDETRKEGSYHVKEIKRSSFIRSWTLPTDLVNKDTVKAKFRDGVLEVSIQKITPIPPPKPEIKTIDIE